MNFSEAMTSVAVVAAVIAAGYGTLSVIRSGRWNHPGHGFGVLAVFWLAWLAWPRHETHEHVVEHRPAVVSDAEIATLLRFEELKNGKP